MSFSLTVQWPRYSCQRVKSHLQEKLQVGTTSQYPGGKRLHSNGFQSAVADSRYMWGLGVMLGIYVAGDSGGFLKSCNHFLFLSLSGATLATIPGTLSGTQFLGGFCAAGII